AGIAVETGVLRDEARELNDAFAHSIRTHLPFVTLKAGLSLDGRIAPAPWFRKTRAPFMLTGAESQAEVQRMRHASDAVITGIGTVLADDPLLTDRTGLARRRPLEGQGIRVEQLEPEPNTSRVPLQRILQRLGELEITSAMLEAGAKLNA